ncbi:cysteine hydrolase [bacterium]|nr:cysteine hydrolase [bacterium]
MRPETTLFYDVDTQRDFLLPGGSLHVPGSERIIPALAEMTRLARRFHIRIFATTDSHRPGDPELERNGGAYPDHCMSGTPGQLKIDETAPLDPLFVPARQLRADEIAAAVAHRGELVIEKQVFDAFAGNPNTRAILRELLRDRPDVVVYGVYTEVCVNDAVRGLMALECRIHLVTDATADIGAEGPAYRDRWAAGGVDLTTVAKVTQELSGGASA